MRFSVAEKLQFFCQAILAVEQLIFWSRALKTNCANFLIHDLLLPQKVNSWGQDKKK
jgi:hypothetical protein